MELIIHSATRFAKHLEALRKSGKIAALAAAKVEILLENLAILSDRAPEVQIKRTKKGELRVRNCQKYDLGGGYRLVCVKEGQHLFLLYVGTHDDCDRWLDNNRGMKIAFDGGHDAISFAEQEAQLISQSSEEERADLEVDEYEHKLLAKIDDKILRQIFRGICKERGENSEGTKQ